MKQHALLFIGDSITDVDRRLDPEGLGFGYVRCVRDILWARHPHHDRVVLNHGIGGDTIRHLERRWATDVLAIKPECLSVSIGVNDVWRHFQDPPNPDAVPPDEFAATYRRLLELTHSSLPECRIFVCEPTPVGEDPGTPHNQWMKAYLDELPSIAADANAILVPMNQTFWRAKHALPSRTWTSDGVHPCSHGHMRMALTFVNAWENAQ